MDRINLALRAIVRTLPAVRRDFQTYIWLRTEIWARNDATNRVYRSRFSRGGNYE